MTLATPTAHPPTVIASWTQGLLAYAEARGLAREPLCAAGGLSPAALDRPEARVPADADTAIWRAAVGKLGDPDLGLHFAERAVSAASLGLLGYLVRSSGDVGEAILRAYRFRRLVKDDVCHQLSLDAQAATLTVAPLGEPGGWPRAIAEAVVATYVVLARQFTSEPVVPLEVRFQHGRPADVATHERLFGCPVYFDQPTNSLRLAREMLAIPLASAEPELAFFLETLARERLERLAATSRAREAQLVVQELLGEGSPIAAVARRLHTSVRSLQRMLHGEGVSYRDLVATAQKARALELLDRRELSLAQVAARVGFSEPGAFRRAFRRWTGRSPAAFRSARAETAAPLPLLKE
jgi:AraC-like DNA-binding protein